MAIPPVPGRAVATTLMFKNGKLSRRRFKSKGFFMNGETLSLGIASQFLVEKIVWAFWRIAQ